MALASEEEKIERERQRIETRKFFDDMESNILRKYDPNYNDEKDNERRDSFDFDQELEGMWDREPGLARRSSIGGIRLVRTISTIDGDSPPLPPRDTHRSMILSTHPHLLLITI